MYSSELKPRQEEARNIWGNYIDDYRELKES